MKKIRISCACLSRIIIDNKYLLLQNKKSKQNGNIVYSPIGGALEYENSSFHFLKNLDVDFEKGKDLRLNLPLENYNSFKEWFLSRKERELSIFREMKEELVDEENILKTLDYLDIKEKLVATIETTQDWIIDGNVKKSYYFFEIFDVQLNEEKINEIKTHLIDEKIKLFTEIEIKTLLNIAGNSKFII